VAYQRSLRGHVAASKALALDPSGNLVSTECVSCVYTSPPQRDYVETYAAGSYEPIQRITKGIDGPVALAIDANGVLYVANSPSLARTSCRCRSWISVYEPGSARPVRRITQGINRAAALAIDPWNDLYVANLGSNSVTVYAPGGATPIQRITDGARDPDSLLIVR
jgi:DNA-binding beta-propeller fold protein YncE